MSISSTEKIKQFLLKEASIKSIQMILQNQERAKVDRGEHVGLPYGFLHHKLNVSILKDKYNGLPTFRGGINVPVYLVKLKNIDKSITKDPELKNKNTSLMSLFKWDWKYESLMVPNKIVTYASKEKKIRIRKWLYNLIYHLYSPDYQVIKNKDGENAYLSEDPFSASFLSKFKIKKKKSNYETTLGFPEYEIIARKIFNKNKNYKESQNLSKFKDAFHRELMKSNVSLHCQCKAFRFYYAYAANKRNSAFPGYEETRPAPTNNPNNYGIGCKHIHVILFGSTSFSGIVKKFIDNTINIVDGKLIIDTTNIRPDTIEQQKRERKKKDIQSKLSKEPPKEEPPKEEPPKEEIINIGDIADIFDTIDKIKDDIKTEPLEKPKEEINDFIDLDDLIGDSDETEQKQQTSFKQSPKEEETFVDLQDLMDADDDPEDTKDLESNLKTIEDDDFLSLEDVILNQKENPINKSGVVTSVEDFNEKQNDLDAEQITVDKFNIDDFDVDI